jgi:hypothetical protein
MLQMANQEIQRKNGVFKLFKRSKEILIDLILLLPYTLMFFITLLLMAITIGIMIPIFIVTKCYNLIENKRCRIGQ